MSSIAYNILRNYFYNKFETEISILLGFIDSERESLYYELSNNNGRSYSYRNTKLDEIPTRYILNIYEIIGTYNNIDKVSEDKIKTSLEMEELSLEFGNLFVNVDKKTYDKRINFFKEINKLRNKKMKSLLKT